MKTALTIHSNMKKKDTVMCLPGLLRSLGLYGIAFLPFLLVCVSSTRAQNIQFTQGNIGSGLENSLAIPIRTYPGRGTATIPITLYYSSRVWRIDNLTTVNDNGSYQTIAQAIFAEHSTSGWKTSLDLPSIEWPKATDEYYYSGKAYCYVCGSNFVKFKVARVYIHMPDGSRIELRKSDQPYQGSIDMSGDFYAVDGSHDAVSVHKPLIRLRAEVCEFEHQLKHWRT